MKIELYCRTTGEWLRDIIAPTPPWPSWFVWFLVQQVEMHDATIYVPEF